MHWQLKIRQFPKRFKTLVSQKNNSLALNKLDCKTQILSGSKTHSKLEKSGGGRLDFKCIFSKVGFLKNISVDKKAFSCLKCLLIIFSTCLRIRF